MSTGMRGRLLVACAAMAVACSLPAAERPPATVAATPVHSTRIILLGTGAGPIPRRLRSQPANLLVADGVPYLIDAGNGVARQLVSVGFEPADVRTLFITHHHVDHNTDLGALMSFTWIEDNERRARNAPVVQIYGPPATSELVHSALEFLDVSARIFSSEVPMLPLAGRFAAHDISADGVVFQDERVKVTAAENTHYHLPPGSAAFAKDKSYSYRFDTADRCVVFTGDTGPSDALARLAEGADVLVSEVVNVDAMLEFMQKTMQMPEDAQAAMRFHIGQEHFAPEEIGRLAARAHVKSVVLTHFSPGLDSETDISRYTDGVRRYFSGTVIAGRDLFEF
jgi:ribonuclease BN (tRNA processing enzyme)